MTGKVMIPMTRQVDDCASKDKSDHNYVRIMIKVQIITTEMLLKSFNDYELQLRSRCR